MQSARYPPPQIHQPRYGPGFTLTVPLTPFLTNNPLLYMSSTVNRLNSFFAAINSSPSNVPTSLTLIPPCSGQSTISNVGRLFRLVTSPNDTCLKLVLITN